MPPTCAPIKMHTSTMANWIKNIVDMNTPLFVKKILKRKRIKADIGGSCCCITSDIHIFVFILNTNTLFD
jgi:hypothetical protein